jgi:hypothetical protein
MCQQEQKQNKNKKETKKQRKKKQRNKDIRNKEKRRPKSQQKNQTTEEERAGNEQKSSLVHECGFHMTPPKTHRFVLSFRFQRHSRQKFDALALWKLSAQTQSKLVRNFIVAGVKSGDNNLLHNVPTTITYAASGAQDVISDLDHDFWNPNVVETNMIQEFNSGGRGGRGDRSCAEERRIYFQGSCFCEGCHDCVVVDKACS